MIVLTVLSENSKVSCNIHICTKNVETRYLLFTHNGDTNTNENEVVRVCFVWKGKMHLK